MWQARRLHHLHAPCFDAPEVKDNKAVYMHAQRSTKTFRQILLSGIVGSALLIGPTSLSVAQPETSDQVTEALSGVTTTLTGTYLSAKLAQDDQDLALAAHFYAQALEKEPENSLLLERNFALTLAVGKHDVAFKLADRMAEMNALKEAARQKAAKLKTEDADEDTVSVEKQQDDDVDHRITPMVHLALGVKALKGKSYTSAAKNFKAGMDELTNHPVDLLGPAPLRRNLNNPRLLSASAQYGPFALISQTVLHAWAVIGQDRKNLGAALKTLEGFDGSDVNQFFFSLHSGLIAAYAKDYPKAIKYLQESLEADPNSISTADALINALLKAGNEKRANEVLTDFLRSAADREDKMWLKTTYGALKPVASSIRSPQDGAAELFTTLGDALSQENAIEGGALYLQFADYLRTNHDQTNFALARLFERMKQDEMALTHFDKISKDSAIYGRAQRQSGFTLTRLKRPDEAITRLEGLLGDNASDLETVSILSRIFQSEQRYRDSIGLLTRGLDSLKTKRDIHWSLYFLRGSAYDQVKDWPNTEKDMLAALKLFPNQPTVLNYLGYSWVDRGLKLDKAIEMIRQAVALRPYDGFFVDSLGWAHYRMAEYEDAVNFLERAVELRPEDPTITDHLGDAYWKAGRKNEAYFQWNRVKTMQPKDDLLKQVDEKIQNGLIDTQDPSKKEK